MATQTIQKSRQGKTTVTMLFPHPVNVTLDDRSLMRFEEGLQEVPAELVDHWYLKSNGVGLYDPEKPESLTPTQRVQLASKALANAQKEAGDDQKSKAKAAMTTARRAGAALKAEEGRLVPEYKSLESTAAREHERLLQFNNRLSEHISRKPDVGSFPSDEELAAYESTLKTLVAERDAQIERVQQATERMAEPKQRLQEIDNEKKHLGYVVRNLQAIIDGTLGGPHGSVGAVR